ncbi:hypothetical protein [Muricoccus radiodurans]|uniref:hypothetical protein n=1 Tax=Muricoccus radiodurans TaxID=2231721 RepID=UPI003CF1AB12
MSLRQTEFEDGERLGKFVLLHDRDGTLQALSASAVVAACETDSGTVLLLPGGRMVEVNRSLRTVLSWFEVGRA